MGGGGGGYLHRIRAPHVGSLSANEEQKKTGLRRA